MRLTLQRIMLFTDDIDKQIIFYRDILGLTVRREQKGFIEFDTGGHSIALHQGKGRKPRFDFTTTGDLEIVRRELNERGAKLGAIGNINGLLFCRGKDREGNSVQIQEISSGNQE